MHCNDELSAANAAVNSGVGLIRCVFPDAAYSAIASKLTEPLTIPLKSTPEGFLSFRNVEYISRLMDDSTAILLGCGLGFSEDTVKLTEFIIKNAKIPVIIDADGINALSTNINILKEAQAPIILTPHPGEMSRLCGKSIAEIISNPVSVAYEFAQAHGVTVVLKGANTVVCGTEENEIYINSTGNAGLARGGSGDLLSGMVVSLLAQGMKPFDAAVCAVYLHGLAADEVAEKTSMRGMLPSDILKALPEFFSKFE